MEYFNFSSAMKVLLGNMNSALYKSELELLTKLFRDYIKECDYHFGGSRVSRWINDKRTLPKIIINYYAENKHQRLLCQTLEEEILSLTNDPMKAALELRESLNNAKNVSDDIKLKLIEGTVFDTDGEIADFICSLLCFAMAQPLKKDMQHTLAKIRNFDLQQMDVIYDADVPSPCNWFQGREKEIRELHRKLLKKHHVFLRGIPGIGKTEAAKRYAQKYKDKYAKILYVSYDETLRKTITELALKSDMPNENPTVRFKKHNHFLKTLPKNVLLIIDNFNNPEDADLDLLQDYSCYLLVTTRNYFKYQNNMELRELNQADLLQLVAAFYSGFEANRKMVEKMIRAVHRHTFVVELAARLLKSGLQDPKTLLEKLIADRVSLKVTDWIWGHKDGKRRKATYYDHIQMLFRMFDLTEQDQTVMCNMVLMPATGVPPRLFAQWLSMEDLNPIQYLLDLGLIQEVSEEEIALHPIIRDVSKSEFHPSFCSCRGLVEVLYVICMARGLEITYHKWLFQCVEGIIAYADIEDLQLFFLFLEGVFWYMEKYQYNSGMKKIVIKMKALLDDPSVGTNRNHAAFLQCKSALEGDNSTKLKYLKKAAELIPQPDESTASLAANLQHNIGTYYLKKGNSEQAYIHMQRAFQILETFGIPRTNDFVVQYTNYANFLVQQGEPQRGYNILKDLKERFEQANQTLCDDYATVLYQMGVILGCSLHTDLAKKHLNRAMDIYERIYATVPKVLEENRQLIDTALREIDSRIKRFDL